MDNHAYYKLYKPYGYLSQRDAIGYKNKKGLLQLYPFPEGVYPIGRLDEDSEGLLLLTSNSKLMDQINRSGIEKEYWVQLDGEITDEAIELLQKGLSIKIKNEWVQTQACMASKLSTEPDLEARQPPPRAGKHRPYSWVSIIIKEGKHRQIRKMTAAVGFPTLRLVRVRIGNILLNDIKPGEGKLLAPIQLDDLRIC